MNDFDREYERIMSLNRRIIKSHMRKHYAGRSAGNPNVELLEKIKDLIKEGQFDDYFYDGEDEQRIEYVDFDTSARAVLNFLKKRGVIKNLL